MSLLFTLILNFYLLTVSCIPFCRISGRKYVEEPFIGPTFWNLLDDIFFRMPFSTAKQLKDVSSQ